MVVVGAAIAAVTLTAALPASDSISDCIVCGIWVLGEYYHSVYSSLSQLGPLHLRVEVASAVAPNEARSARLWRLGQCLHHSL